LLVLLLAGCENGGGGGGGSANASVYGRAAGADFDFTPSQVGARFESKTEGEGVLSIFLCEAGCAEVGATALTTAEVSRSVSLEVEGTTAELRGGGTFPIGSKASGFAQLVEDAQLRVDDAVAGEVEIQSCDLREDGRTVGTFQLELDSGGTVSGFFEAPVVEVSGELVLLDDLRCR
jgi:hypothetical protein